MFPITGRIIFLTIFLAFGGAAALAPFMIAANLSAMALPAVAFFLVAGYLTARWLYLRAGGDLTANNAVRAMGWQGFAVAFAAFTLGGLLVSAPPLLGPFMVAMGTLMAWAVLRVFDMVGSVGAKAR